MGTLTKFNVWCAWLKPVIFLFETKTDMPALVWISADKEIA